MNGTKVIVTMTRNDCFDFQAGPTFEAELTGESQGPGDLFRFQVGPRTVYINGNASDFVGFVTA